MREIGFNGHDQMRKGAEQWRAPSHQRMEEKLKQWVEQDDPGVYITLTTLSDGGRDLKRVRLR